MASNIAVPQPSPLFLPPQEVYEETDDAFYVGLSRSRSEQLLFISCGSAVTSEERWLKADDPTGGAAGENAASA